MKFDSFLCICTQTSITLPFLSNIPASPAYTYGVYISQLIRFSRACVQYSEYLDRAHLLTQKLLKQGYVAPRLKSFCKNTTVVITIWLTVTKYPYLK